MRHDTGASANGSVISVRVLVIGSFALVAAGILLLSGAMVWSHEVNHKAAARADMAYAQALQVSQLEAAAAALDPADDAARAALSQLAQTYLASIAEEALLFPEEPDDQADERERAQQLISAIMAGDAASEIRALASAIAVSELAEAAEARRRAEAASRRTRTIVMVAAAAVLLVPLVLLLALQRLLALPLRRLEEAARQVTDESPQAPLAPRGLAEIRQLTMRFNTMTEAVEARVAARTTALEIANAELAALDRRRRLFLAKVSHELRTPVTAIRGEAEVALRHSENADELREALGHIEDTSLFLSRRLDDLMVLARAEDARLPVDAGLTQPFAAARRACEAAAAYARTSGVSIAAEALPPAGGEAVLVTGEADRLQQAIAAVIDNAIKFSPPGSAVRVSGALEDHLAIIRIIDSGPGAAPEDLLRIFDPYVQSDRGRALGGTGLGLSLARWIAEAYQGTIMAEPAQTTDQGACGLCVTLRLPIAG